MRLEQLKSDFDILDDWQDRYRHIIELGRELPPLAEALRVPANKVSGCASQVWLASSVSGPSDNPVLHFAGDSDALIVKGLIAIAFMLYSDRSAREILATDASGVLAGLGLVEHLTPQRSNGFAAMIRRIKSDASAALQGDSSAGMSGR